MQNIPTEVMYVVIGLAFLAVQFLKQRLAPPEPIAETPTDNLHSREAPGAPEALAPYFGRAPQVSAEAPANYPFGEPPPDSSGGETVSGETVSGEIVRPGSSNRPAYARGPELRQAIVLMTVLGPCRAQTPDD